MKKKSIIAICAVLVILVLAAVLVLTGNRGNVSNVNRVVGYSALYGENSINEAFDVIEKKFAKDFEGCTLTELRLKSIPFMPSSVGLNLVILQRLALFMIL